MTVPHGSHFTGWTPDCCCPSHWIQRMMGTLCPAERLPYHTGSGVQQLFTNGEAVVVFLRTVEWGTFILAFSMWLPTTVCLTSLPGFFWNLPWYFHSFTPSSLQRSEAINQETMTTSRLSSSTEGRWTFSFPAQLLWVFRVNTTHILEDEGLRTANLCL